MSHYFKEEKRRTHVITMRLNDKEYQVLRDYMDYRGEKCASDFIRSATLSWIGSMRHQEQMLERRELKREYKNEYKEGAVNTKANTEAEKESNKEKESINLSISSASTNAPACDSESAYVWLTDEPDRLRTLCINNDLPPDNPLGTLAPYIRAFLGWLTEIGTDFYLKGAEDTKKHFAAWLPKYLKMNNKNNYNNGNSKQCISSNVRESQKLDEIGHACAAALAVARSGRGLL